LGEYDEALSFALGAGNAFEAESRAYGAEEYVETVGDRANRASNMNDMPLPSRGLKAGATTQHLQPGAHLILPLEIRGARTKTAAVTAMDGAQRRSTHGVVTQRRRMVGGGLALLLRRLGGGTLTERLQPQGGVHLLVRGRDLTCSCLVGRLVIQLAIGGRASTRIYGLNTTTSLVTVSTSYIVH
jgi:hypothetical protein